MLSLLVQALQLTGHFGTDTIRWYARARRRVAGALANLVRLPGKACVQTTQGWYVLGETDIAALMLPGVLDDSARSSSLPLVHSCNTGSLSAIVFEVLAFKSVLCQVGFL